MNEDAPTMSTATAGGAGFSHKAAATGPNAGIDPVMNFKKKVQKRKKQMKEDIKLQPNGPSKLYQYKVSLPEVGETIVYANSVNELTQKIRLLINPRYRGDVKIERIMRGDAGKFFMNKRMKHLANVNEAEDERMKQEMAQSKIAIEKKKIMLKKQQLQKQLQMKTQSLKKQARAGAEQDETR